MSLATNNDHIDLIARQLLRKHGIVLGKHRGKVTKVGTGENLGRIKAVIPTLFHEEETVWADPVVPFAGKQHGMAFLPEVGDGVWMEFEGGSTSRPIWTGFFWGAKQMPPGITEKVRVIATSHGHRVVLDDDKNEMRLEHGSGPKIVLGKDSITLTVGGKKLVLDTRGLTVNDGALEVT